MNCVFKKTDENNRFSITITRHWNSTSGEKTVNETMKLLELRSKIDIEKHVKRN